MQARGGQLDAERNRLLAEQVPLQAGWIAPPARWVKTQAGGVAPPGWVDCTTGKVGTSQGGWIAPPC